MRCEVVAPDVEISLMTVPGAVLDGASQFGSRGAAMPEPSYEIEVRRTPEGAPAVWVRGLDGPDLRFVGPFHGGNCLGLCLGERVNESDGTYRPPDEETDEEPLAPNRLFVRELRGRRTDVGRIRGWSCPNECDWTSRAGLLHEKRRVDAARLLNHLRFAEPGANVFLPHRAHLPTTIAIAQ